MRWPWTRRTRVLVLTGGTAILLALAWVVAVHVLAAPTVRARASSTGPDSRASALLSPGRDARTPHVEARPVTWRSRNETVGAWIDLAWSARSRVDHVEVRAAGGGTAAPTSATLTFDGGASLLLTPNRSGDVDLDFPRREVSRVRLTVAGVRPGASSVALAALRVDDSGPEPPNRRAATARGTASASSTDGGTPPSALVDGDRAGPGGEWRAAASDDDPWVQVTWAAPRETASVQVFGPQETASDPADPAAAALRGLLRFSDGSTVVVSGIAGGDAQPTTVAFMPRMATSVRLELSRTVPGAVLGLRGLAVYTARSTPPRWPSPAPTYAETSADPPPCTASSSPVAPPRPGALSLVCPAPGASVRGRATIVVGADPGTAVSASAWVPQEAHGEGSMRQVAVADADGGGHATLSFSADALTAGPLTIEVTEPTGPEEPAAVPLYVQLVNEGGRHVASPGFAPRGMTLQWDEDFSRPLSVTQTGDGGAVYAATKPSADGPSGFGNAVFADPAGGSGNLTTLDGHYLRIRARPLPGTAESGPGYLGGLLSSAHVGAAGFAAQYGYFEARMMGAPGQGTWPAFWMLDTDSATPRNATVGEADAVELYGQYPQGSCHSLHSWGGTGPAQRGAERCHAQNGFSPWVMAWHTYGMRITPGGAVFSIDGVQVASERGLSHTSEPFFFMVDLALGGGWPVDLGPTGGISDLYVDWIRVYT